MPPKLSIFSKVIIMVILLLIPILVLYSFSNRTANQVIQDQIQSSNLNQLSFFANQLDSNIENLSLFPVIIGYDPYVREFIDKTEPSYDVLKAQSRITEKLGLQSVSHAWSNDLTLVLPKEGAVFSSSIYLNGTSAWTWKDPIHKEWTLIGDRTRGSTVGTFVREISEPANAVTTNQADAVFQVKFSIENMVNLMDVYKRDKQSDPFLYHAQFNPILNSTSSRSIVEPVIRQLGETDLKDSGQTSTSIAGQEYLISYVKSKSLGWYLVDYVPVESILSPITKTSNLFYLTIALLLIMSVMASFLLYRHVQIPIIQITRSLQKMKRGDLSTRIEYRSKNEFDYLIQRFNDMAEQIQVLVEDVYAEKLRSREATLKQLQSQINPHFLYNSLFFIINSAEMEDREAVVTMAHNLAEFYRYTTRVENQSVRLRDELEFVTHYLNIQNLRMHRLVYTITVPEAMMDEMVPRLIIQPLVENAIIHGIEHRIHGGTITITGEQTFEHNRIVVEDNGAGLSLEKLHHLHAQLQEPMSEEIGCGTWNVHQRLYYQFGEGSKLSFQPGSDGGLRAILTWNRNKEV